MTQRPRDALSARLMLLPPLPSPDDETAAPTRFFRDLLERQQQPKPAIDAEALYADHQRLQNRLSDALTAFHAHRALHGIEFCVVLAKYGHAAARPYMADVSHWIAELERMVSPETSAVPGVIYIGRGR